MPRSPFRFFPLLCLGFTAFLVIIVYLADTGQGQKYWAFLGRIPGGDKLGHFFLFGTLAMLADLSSPGWRWRPRGWSLPIGGLVVLAAATLEEISQAWLPTRTFDLIDLSADALGIAAAALAARWIHSRFPVGNFLHRDRVTSIRVLLHAIARR